MDTVNITNSGMIAGFLLVIIPLVISHYFQLKMGKDTVWSIFRMSIQLLFVGIFLEYIFAINNPLLNFGWLSLMIMAAVMSVIKKSKIKTSVILWPTIFSFAVPTVLMLIYFNSLVIRLDFLFEARYLIALGGMLLGNVLGVNITALNSFYQEIRTQNKFYLYRLAMGTSQRETLLPFFRKSFHLSLLPALAKTAAIGLVSLPGMMTGQILGGSSPATAIKYQIMIMIAIYVTTVVSALFSLLFTTKKCFNGFGILKTEIFK